MEDYFLQRKYVNNTLGPDLSADIICSALGKDNVRGQISDRIFEPIGGYSVYYSSNIFRNTRGFFKLEGIFWISPSFSWRIFRNILDSFRPIARERKYLMDYKSRKSYK